MLRTQLIEHKESLEATHASKIRRFSLLGRRYNHSAEILAINKFLIDLDMHAVKYTDTDINILKSGKLKHILDSHRREWPDGFRHLGAMECRTMIG